jgi:hypothetical protein
MGSPLSPRTVNTAKPTRFPNSVGNRTYFLRIRFHPKNVRAQDWEGADLPERAAPFVAVSQQVGCTPKAQDPFRAKPPAGATSTASGFQSGQRGPQVQIREQSEKAVRQPGRILMNIRPRPEVGFRPWRPRPPRPCDRAPKRSPFVRWAAGSTLEEARCPPVNPHAWPKGGLNRSDPDTLTAGARIAPCGRPCGRSWRPASSSDSMEEREDRRAHLRKIADRLLTGDAREYPANDPSRSVDRPGSAHPANGPGGSPWSTRDRGPAPVPAAALVKWLIQKTPARASHLTPFFIPETFADCPPCMQVTNCIRPHAHLTRRKRGG